MPDTHYERADGNIMGLGVDIWFYPNLSRNVYANSKIIG